MSKIFAIVFLALIAYASAGYLGVPSAVVYSSPAEYPSASGYEYQHTIQTPDYVNHASVVKPLNGFAAAPVAVRAVYDSPVAYAHVW